MQIDLADVNLLVEALLLCIEQAYVVHVEAATVHHAVGYTVSKPA